MRDYVLKKKNKDYIAKNVLMQVKYRLLGYGRVKKELELLRGKKKLSAQERKRLKLIEKEVLLIDEACAQMAARLEPYSDDEFEVIAAYFSYEHYNLHIRRSANPDDAGASPRKWSGYKRDFARVLADKLKIV